MNSEVLNGCRSCSHLLILMMLSNRDIKHSGDRITNPVFSAREVTGQEGHEAHVQGSAFPTALAAGLSQEVP